MIGYVLLSILFSILIIRYVYVIFRSANRSTMRKLDYGINSLGIISTLAIFGLLGKIAFVLGTFLWFLNFYVCVISVGVLIFKGCAKIISLFPNRGETASLSSGSWRYLFYAFTNSLPMLAPFIILHFDLELWS